MAVSEDKKEQVTKDQHYVPQFYLRKFSNAEEKLEILDCERRKIIKPRTPKSVCSEEYYYSVNNELDEASQVLEKEFQRIEDNVSKVYDEIARRFTNFEEIGDDDKILLATFMSLQYLRGPYMREQVKRMDEKMTKEMIKLRFGAGNTDSFLEDFRKETGKEVSEEEKKKLVEMAENGDYKVEFSNKFHLNLIGEMEGFRNLLYAKEWTVYISKSSKKFITSDNPVLEIFPERPRNFAYGPSFLQRTHQFTMTPDILIVTTHPKNPPKIGKIKRKTLFDNPKDNDRFLDMNIIHARKANAFAYANNSSSLQDILDTANLYDKQEGEMVLRLTKNKGHIKQ